VGTIDQPSQTCLLNLPVGTDLKILIPVIIFSDKATIYPQSDTPQDFSNPIVYQVTAEDGSTQDYTVNAKIIQAPEEVKTQEQGMPTIVKILLAIACLAFIAIVGLVVFLFIKSKKTATRRK
jgi:hypothetical protein